MMVQFEDRGRQETGEVEQEIVRTLESLSRRVKHQADLPGLPGAKRPEEEVMLREKPEAKA
jgi:hypothetical protein